ncbi:MAG: 1,4-dihydroxy-2-naphthoate polyprenyltransferase [Deltaproteobacteria bacterium]|nr:MAG: 1,4-dihydroxy-2-naphthoate polyprenyltransferase [Deltaproteobacteria bacterium]
MSSVVPGSPRAWILAARPKTLPAAIVPVMVGTSVAYAHGEAALLPAFAALLGALLIQIGTNFANDYFDFASGADTAKRLGPTRAVQAGLLHANAVKGATALSFGLAGLVGLYLVAVAGWPIAVIGVLSILSGLAYTGGPYPLGYHALGDLFVFLFFGLIAVTGTHYVQAVTFSFEALTASVPIGLLATAILVVNNYRDLKTDAEAGKNTLAVRIGRRATRAFYLALLLGAYAVPVGQVLAGGRIALLLPLVTLPLALLLARGLGHREGAQLNPLLARTAALMASYGLLYAIGWVL